MHSVAKSIFKKMGFVLILAVTDIEKESRLAKTLWDKVKGKLKTVKVIK